MKHSTKLMPVPGDGTGAALAYQEAATLLKSGNLVAFPSETVYGLGADACNQAAVTKVFEAKGRPADNPLIIHVASQQQALQHGVADERFFKLATAFWPGPLTMVLPKTETSAAVVSRGLDTVALRMPAHPVALRLISETGCALAAPSANLSGKPSPTLAQHVLSDLKGKIPLILDGGACRVGIESTVVDLSSSKTSILRPGQISANAIAKVLGGSVEHAEKLQQKQKSPGTRYRHYQPHAPLWLLDSDLSAHDWKKVQQALGSKRWGYAGTRDFKGQTQVIHQPIGPSAEDIAKNLYAVLRQFDEQGVALIILDAPVEDQKNRAIWDRLEKAATGLISNAAQIAQIH